MTSFVFLSLGALGFASSILLLHGPARQKGCFLGSDREVALQRGARPINIEMSLSSLYRKRPTGCTSGISFYRLIRAPAPVHLHEYITQARGSFSSSCRSTHEQTLSFFCSPPSLTLPPSCQSQSHSYKSSPGRMDEWILDGGGRSRGERRGRSRTKPKKK